MKQGGSSGPDGSRIRRAAPAANVAAGKEGLIRAPYPSPVSRKDITSS